MRLLKNIFTFCILLASSLGLAQSEKQLNKAISTYEKNMSKGIEKLEKYIEKSAHYGNDDGWNTLINMKYYQYTQLNELYSAIKIDVEGENDSLNKITAKEIKSGMTSAIDQSFINACREATIKSTSNKADFHLRKMLIDIDPDTLVSEKALAYFNEAENSFMKRDNELAILNYRKAVETAPAYYKANLYLGDALWLEENYDSAIYYLSIAKELQPNLMEPRKFLIDALADKELWYRAKQECISALCIYPSNDIKYKLQAILRQENKWLNEHKIKKDFYANNMLKETQPVLIPPYQSYRSAKNLVAAYTNDTGLIEQNDLTNETYLEVYSWKQFLKENEDNLPVLFRFAKKMEKEDYLDCYVFFSFFHVDIYPQFQDFITKEGNKEKMERFINEFLIETYK
ncbi:hypothetical protein DNU06_01915 [Putridiphycobacter roseus]|uniref:Uncharacterized protein n=1 Tax=Putridiphycobacter roseus TaxID=2219161 RepID=A0A2W1N619_9FLAO|nr:tetratricopeptide repeat protein [Putridiphycobacter roseus]PZE18611.1 hypothetical protein DNU06_01915 [Putridiphycobacter roseus]